MLSKETNFTWNMTLYNSFTLRIIIKFEDPREISATSYGRDGLRIVFADTSMFLRCVDFGRLLESTLPNGFELFISIPP